MTFLYDPVSVLCSFWREQLYSSCPMLPCTGDSS